jgi:hypothetical protein
MNISLYIPLIALTTTMNLAQATTLNEETCRETLAEAIAFSLATDEVLDKCIDGDSIHCDVYLEVVKTYEYSEKTGRTIACVKEGHLDINAPMVRLFIRQIKETKNKLVSFMESLD